MNLRLDRRIGVTMNRAHVVIVVAALTLSDLPTHAQPAATKPTCLAGDVVVWENTNTKAYHLSGDKFYGNTKHGAYACRSEADRAGYHLAGAKSKAATDVGSPAPTSSDAPAAHHHHHHTSATISPSPAPSPAAT